MPELQPDLICERLRHGMSLDDKELREADVTCGREANRAPAFRAALPLPSSSQRSRRRSRAPFVLLLCLASRRSRSWAGDDPESHTCLRFVLREGRYRQIRRMCEQVGLKVLRLRRTRVGNLRLGGLRTGEWKVIWPGQVDGLFPSAGDGKGS